MYFVATQEHTELKPNIINSYNQAHQKVESKSRLKPKWELERQCRRTDRDKIMRERSHFVDKVGEKLFPYAPGVADFPHWRKGDTDCSVPFLGASAIVIRAVGSRDLKVLFSFVYVYTYMCMHVGAWANVGCFPQLLSSSFFYTKSFIES